MEFKEVVNTVKSGAEDAIEVAKLKTKVSKEKAAIKSSYQKIGELVYAKEKEGTDSEAEIAELIEKIDEAKANIETLKEDIDKVKNK